MNIALLLEMAADAAPDRIALVCEGRRWSYADLLRAAKSGVELIRTSGVEFVALLDESSEASVIALFAAALAGIPYCPLNYRLADADLAALLQRLHPALVIGDDGRAGRLLGEAAGFSFLSREDFVDKVTSRAPAEDAEYDGGEGIAVQLFTSGTTAAPKAAILGHMNLTSYILGTVEFGSAEESDAALVSVPPYHIAGIAAILSSVYALRRIVLLPSFSPEGWLKLVADEGVTNAFVVPTMLSRIVPVLEKGGHAIGSLRNIAYGGGKMPLELIRKALDLMPDTGFTNAYGLTETSSTIAVLAPEDHRAAHAATSEAERARLASVGRPLPTVELEVRDEDGRVLPPGQTGEIYVRGPQVSGQYRERSALDADGWFPTRDAGYLDEDGFLFLIGRADDVIVRGGENISPAEIEEVLLGHPSVGDAAAVAVPSEEWGEAVGVAIVARPGCSMPAEQDVRELIRSRLRSSRVPEKIIWVPELPYNEMGKLLRREVRGMFG